MPRGFKINDWTLVGSTMKLETTEGPVTLDVSSIVDSADKITSVEIVPLADGKYLEITTSKTSQPFSVKLPDSTTKIDFFGNQGPLITLVAGGSTHSIDLTDPVYGLSNIELFVNPDFNQPLFNGWNPTSHGGWSISGGKAIANGIGYLVQEVTLEAGEYIIQIEVESITQGVINLLRENNINSLQVGHNEIAFTSIGGTTRVGLWLPESGQSRGLILSASLRKVLSGKRFGEIEEFRLDDSVLILKNSLSEKRVDLFPVIQSLVTPPTTSSSSVNDTRFLLPLTTSEGAGYFTTPNWKTTSGWISSGAGASCIGNGYLYQDFEAFPREIYEINVVVQSLTSGVFSVLGRTGFDIQILFPGTYTYRYTAESTIERIHILSQGGRGLVTSITVKRIPSQSLIDNYQSLLKNLRLEGNILKALTNNGDKIVDLSSLSSHGVTGLSFIEDTYIPSPDGFTGYLPGNTFNFSDSRVTRVGISYYNGSGFGENYTNDGGTLSLRFYGRRLLIYYYNYATVGSLKYLAGSNSEFVEVAYNQSISTDVYLPLVIDFGSVAIHTFTAMNSAGPRISLTEFSVLPLVASEITTIQRALLKLNTPSGILEVDLASLLVENQVAAVQKIILENPIDLETTLEGTQLTIGNDTIDLLPAIRKLVAPVNMFPERVKDNSFSGINWVLGSDWSVVNMALRLNTSRGDNEIGKVSTHLLPLEVGTIYQVEIDLDVTRGFLRVVQGTYPDESVSIIGTSSGVYKEDLVAQMSSVFYIYSGNCDAVIRSISFKKKLTQNLIDSAPSLLISGSVKEGKLVLETNNGDKKIDISDAVLSFVTPPNNFPQLFNDPEFLGVISYSLDINKWLSGADPGWTDKPIISNGKLILRPGNPFPQIQYISQRIVSLTPGEPYRITVKGNSINGGLAVITSNLHGSSSFNRLLTGEFSYKFTALSTSDTFYIGSVELAQLDIDSITIRQQPSQSFVDSYKSLLTKGRIEGSNLVLSTNNGDKVIDLRSALIPMSTPPENPIEILKNPFFDESVLEPDNGWGGNIEISWTPGILILPWGCNIAQGVIGAIIGRKYRITVVRGDSTSQLKYYSDNDNFASQPGISFNTEGIGVLEIVALKSNFSITFQGQYYDLPNKISSISMKILPSQSELDNYPSLVSGLSLEGSVLKAGTSNGVKSVDLAALSSHGVTGVSFSKDIYLPTPDDFNGYLPGESYNFSDSRVSRVGMTIYTGIFGTENYTNTGGTVSFRFYGRRLTIYYYNYGESGSFKYLAGVNSEFVGVTYTPTLTVYNYHPLTIDFGSVAIHTFTAMNYVGPRMAFTDFLVHSLIPGEVIPLQRALLRLATPSGEVSTDLVSLLVENQAPSVQRIIGDSISVLGSDLIVTSDTIVYKSSLSSITSGIDIIDIPVLTAQVDGQQSFSIPYSITKIIEVQVLEIDAQGYKDTLIPGTYSGNRGTLSVSAEANLRIGDKLYAKGFSGYIASLQVGPSPNYLAMNNSGLFLNFPGIRSISFWIRSTGLNSSGFFAEGRINSGEPGYWYNAGSGQGMSGTIDGTPIRTDNTPGDYDRMGGGTWHLVTISCIFGSTGVSLFSSNAYNPLAPMGLFDLADMRVYSRELTSVEKANIRKADIPTDSLLARYDFTAITSTEVINQSGFNGRNAKFIGLSGLAV